METVSSKSLKSQSVISQRVITNAKRFGMDLDVSYTLLFRVINWDKSLVDGHIFALLHNGRENPEAIEAEFCLPINPEVTKIPENIVVQVIPSCTIALCGQYSGNLDEINPVYDRIKEYAELNYYKLAYPIRETYIDYSSETPCTEIAWPISEAL